MPFQPLYPHELVARTVLSVAWLRQMGISEDAILAVQSDAPACWSRIWALARAAGQPFMPVAPGRDLSQLMARAGSAALLGCGEGNPAGLRVLQLSNATGAYRPLPNSADPLDLIIQTSGSEGEPRGIIHSRAAIEAASRAACQRLDYGPDDIWLNCLPPWHIGGITIMERALYRRAQVILLGKFDPERLWQALLEHPVTHLSLVPVMLSRLMELSAGRPPESLRRVLIGGAALPEPLYQRATDNGWPLCVTYGLSEACSQVATYCMPGDDWQPGDMGLPLDGMEVEIADDGQGHGRIRLRGPMLMSGYLDDTNPISTDGWLQTNDLGRIDEKGHLHLFGRADDMIITGGVKVHPVTVERCLYGYPDIGAVVVIGMPDAEYGERVTAVVTGEVDGRELMAWCRDRLDSAHRPRHVIRMASLPLNGPGKVDRAAVRKINGALLPRISHQNDRRLLVPH